MTKEIDMEKNQEIKNRILKFTARTLHVMPEDISVLPANTKTYPLVVKVKGRFFSMRQLLRLKRKLRFVFLAVGDGGLTIPVHRLFLVRRRRLRIRPSVAPLRPVRGYRA